MVNSFIFFLWVVLPLTYPGDPVWRLGPLVATHQGIAFTALITLKSNAIIIGLIALIATVPVITLGQALHTMRLPDKLCHLLLFTYRYLYVFELEFHRLVQAMKIRGFQPRTNLHTYRSYAYLAAMLLVRSYDRAETRFPGHAVPGFPRRLLQPADLFLAAPGWDFSNRVLAGLGGASHPGVAESGPLMSLR